MEAGVKFIWEDGATAPTGSYHRCHLAKSIRVHMKGWNGSKHSVVVNQVGYIKVTDHGTFHANVYGSISKQPPASFTSLDEAKAYVETHATTGLVIKKLHVDV
jgi:hypothetical protein